MNASGDDEDSGPRGEQPFSGSAPSERDSAAGGRSSESPLGKAFRDIAPYLDLGWRLAGTTAGPPGLGLIVDLWLDTTPWVLLGGCVVGLAGAVLQLKRLQSEERP